LIEAPDQCRYVLERPIVRPAGVTYSYNGGLTALLAAILRKASGLPVDEIAREALFEPLGIKDVEWNHYKDGTTMAASGLRMRPRDVAKIGQVVAGGGIWKDQRIVSRSWIDESTAPQIHGEALFFYGYHWWLGRSLIDRQEVTWIAGVGYGGQRLYVVPSLDLVVLVMAGLYDEPVLQSIVGDVVLRRYALPAAMIRAT
jgi:CubicO group peptidase (beta-lactamase class C family)